MALCWAAKIRTNTKTIRTVSSNHTNLVGMIIARLVERIEINHDYDVEIKFRISVEQYMRIAA